MPATTTDPASQKTTTAAAREIRALPGAIVYDHRQAVEVIATTAIRGLSQCAEAADAEAFMAEIDERIGTALGLVAAKRGWKVGR